MCAAQAVAACALAAALTPPNQKSTTKASSLSVQILVDPRNLIKDPTSGEDTAVTANVVFKSFVNAS